MQRTFDPRSAGLEAITVRGREYFVLVVQDGFGRFDRERTEVYVLSGERGKTRIKGSERKRVLDKYERER